YETTVLASATTSTESEDFNKYFKLFPNPTNGDQIWIEIIGDVEVEVFELLNLQGQLLHQAQLTDQKNEISIRQLPQGTYLARLKNKDGGIFQRLFVRQ
ncbi:MAG: T9SS type A sorting domain-containing protein, partial [Bacteroidota bacterium]